jgi:hypothetical protein
MEVTAAGPIYCRGRFALHHERFQARALARRVEQRYRL